MKCNYRRPFLFFCGNINITALFRKKSPLHQGVIYLVMPKDIVNDEWEDAREDGLSPQPHNTTQPPEPAASGGGGNDSNEECALDEEDEKEQSLSVPASPRPTRRPPPLIHVHGRVQRLHSQSFDNILSNINNEEDLPPSPSNISKIQRNISVIVSPLDPDSNSDTETVSISKHGLGVAYSQSLLVSSQPELAGSSVAPQGLGRLNRLKGKFFQKVRRGHSQKVESLQVPRQTQRHSDRPTSGSGSDAAQDVAEETNSHQLSHMTHRLLAVGQRFRNSPSLLRRMGVGGHSHSAHQAPPISSSETGNGVDGGESRREAKAKSQSTFITL